MGLSKQSFCIRCAVVAAALVGLALVDGLGSAIIGKNVNGGLPISAALLPSSDKVTSKYHVFRPLKLKRAAASLLR